MPSSSYKTLKASGMRTTRQRALILEIIRQGHWDADEIYRRARKKEPRISLSTVYRALQMLKRLGLVEELHLDNAHHRYEMRPSTEHHHLVCLGCGRVIEFEYPLSRQIKRKVSEARDFDIAETAIRVTGYCSRCSKSEE
jgi:Fe2+ or Zn2+ uptake regulation protein